MILTNYAQNFPGIGTRHMHACPCSQSPHDPPTMPPWSTLRAKEFYPRFFMIKISSFVLLPMPCRHLSSMPTTLAPCSPPPLASATLPHFVLFLLSYVCFGEEFLHVALLFGHLIGHVTISCRPPPPPRASLYIEY